MSSFLEAVTQLQFCWGDIFWLSIVIIKNQVKLINVHPCRKQHKLTNIEMQNRDIETKSSVPKHNILTLNVNEIFPNAVVTNLFVYFFTHHCYIIFLDSIYFRIAYATIRSIIFCSILFLELFIGL